MKLLVIPGAIIVGIVLAAALIGAFLPAQHIVTREAGYQVPAQAIWQAITDYQKFPEWRKMVIRVEPLPTVSGRPSWRELDAHGASIPYEVVEWTPPQRLVTRIADPKLPFGGTWTFEIFPLPAGATLRITENGEVRNVIYRFMVRYAFGNTITLDAYLKALGQKFGENVSIEN